VSMPERVWVGSAAQPGPDHYRRRINRQDQVLFVRYGKWIIGAISDGCSSARMSEVGAGNLVHIAVQSCLLGIIGGVKLQDFPPFFSKAMTKGMTANIASYPFGPSYLDSIGKNQNFSYFNYPEGCPFMYLTIDELYQATLLVVCVHEDEGGVVMVRGDGSVNVNGEIVTYDYNDMPPYLAYDFALDKYPGDPHDLKFKTVHVPKAFSRLALTSDGWRWGLKETQPFGRWSITAFETWMLYENSKREADLKPPYSVHEAWMRFKPEEVNNLARLLVKKPVTDAGIVLVSDDLSGIFIERQVYE
jgi:hypothetical protein